MKGMGELHLDILVDRLKREFKVEANVGAPQVAYRETIGHEVEHDLHAQEAVGRLGPVRARSSCCCSRPNRARATRSNRRSSAARFPRNTSRASRRASSRSWIRVRLRASRSSTSRCSCSTGSLSTMSTRRCSPSRSRRAMRMREGLRKAGAKLLEPMMKVEVVTPEEYTGGIIGDLTSRRGQMQGQDTRGNAIAIDSATCRSPTCSATSTPCGPCPRAGRTSRCSSTITSRCRRTSPTRSRRSSRKRRRATPAGPAGVAPDPDINSRRLSPWRKAKFERNEAACEHRDDRSRGSRQDDADGGDHEVFRRLQGLRPDRRGARGEGAGDHDLDGACGVRDAGAALRACRLPGPCRLREEHDHRGGADGRRDPGGERGGRADAADARAHPAGPPGRHPGTWSCT